MNPDLIFIGSLEQLTVLPPFTDPVIGFPGGYALYAAAGARVWSSSVKIISRVGENFSREWLEDMQRSGIDTTSVRILPGYHDHRAFEGYSDHFERFTDKPISHFLARGFEFPKELFNYHLHSDIAQVQDQDLQLNPKPDRVPASCQFPDGVLIGPIGFKSQFQWLSFYRSKGIQTIGLAFDPSYADPRNMDKIRSLIEGVDVLFIHEEDLMAIFRGQSLTRWSMMARLAEWDIKLIITLQPLNQQLLYIPFNTEKWILPTYNSEIVDPSGHIEVFCGAFLARFAQTHDAILSAVSGNVTASVCMETTGYKPILESMPQLIDRRVSALLDRVFKV